MIKESFHNNTGTHINVTSQLDRSDSGQADPSKGRFLPRTPILGPPTSRDSPGNVWQSGSRLAGYLVECYQLMLAINLVIAPVVQEKQGPHQILQLPQLSGMDTCRLWSISDIP